MSGAANIALCLSLAASMAALRAEEKAPKKDPAPAASSEPTPLNKNGTVLLDAKGKRLLIKTEVVLREGLLEMLLCLKQTKEHESLLSVDSRAQYIHAGLLALGAEPGSPVKFSPEYKPATGQALDIFLTWTDGNGKLHRDPAQTWVRNATRRDYTPKLEKFPADLKLPENSELKWSDRLKELIWYGHMTEAQRDSLLKLSKDAPYQAAIKSIFEQSQIRQMDAQWVFAGSGFNTDTETVEKYYLAESGDVICVANFATATIDLSIESSASDDGRLYEAYTERIPPVGTKVTVELVPVFKNPAK